MMSFDKTSNHETNETKETKTMILAKDKGGNFTPAPQGTHVARCYAVVDIGTHSFTWQGKTSRGRKVRLSWELPEETFIDSLTQEERVFTVSKEFTLSLSAKSRLRPLLESWRGREFTKEELESFDLAKLIGAPGLITILHKTTGTGRTVADVQTVAKLPKTMKCPPAVSPPFEYSIDQGQNEKFQSMPDWMKQKLLECEEWTPTGNGEEPQAGAPESPIGEDCPF